MLSLFLLDDSLFLFRFQDSVRKQAKKLIEQLVSHHKLQPLILTGDSIENAQMVANELQIDEIYAALKPEEKLAKVAHFSRKKGLAMVGDGINDAPALARATVGIALGKIASAKAISASDVILLNDEIFLLSWLLDKAKATRKIVKENLTLAFLVILLASLPALLGLIPLWLAVILHEGGTILVGLNSLRLIKK